MNKITKYIAVATMASTLALPLFSFAHEGVGLGADADLKADLQANAGTVTAVSGNSVTVNLSNASDVKVGDNITVVDRTFMEANRPVVGTVTAVGNDTLTIQKPNGSSVTVNTSASTTIKKDGQPASASAITVGSNIGVRGTWDSAKTTISAAMINIFTKIRHGWGNLFKHHVNAEVKGSADAD